MDAMQNHALFRDLEFPFALYLATLTPHIPFQHLHKSYTQRAFLELGGVLHLHALRAEDHHLLKQNTKQKTNAKKILAAIETFDKLFAVNKQSLQAQQFCTSLSGLIEGIPSKELNAEAQHLEAHEAFPITS